MKRCLIVGILAFSFLIRLWKIDVVPTSLFGDELDVGYQAYSILKTGRDYSDRLLPLQFKSFTEYRTPLYLYAAVPSVAIFGITPLGVRLPAIIFGTLGVLGLYLLTKEITEDEKISIIASTVLAISPWQIHYSRAAFEVTLLLFVYIYSLYFFLKSLSKPIYLVISAILFAFAPWVYSTAQLFTPLLIISTMLIWFKKLINKDNIVIKVASVIIFVSIYIPYAVSTFSGAGIERFSTISIFEDIEMEGKVGEKRLEDLQMFPILEKTGLTRLFHNKYQYVLRGIVGNYLHAHSSDYLFLKGDGNPRHNSSGGGQLYLIESIFLLAGLYCFYKLKLKKKRKILVFTLLLLSPVPSALTIDGANHASRLIIMLIYLPILISCGIWGIYEVLPKSLKKCYMPFILFMYSISFINYQHNYWVHFPLDTEKQWGYGWKEVVEKVNVYSKDYKKVVISNGKGAAFLNYLALSMYSPEKYLLEKDRELLEVGGFGSARYVENTYFPEGVRGYNLYNLSSAMEEDMIYVVSHEEIGLDLINEPDRLPLDLKLVDSVKYISEDPAFYFLTKQGLK